MPAKSVSRLQEQLRRVAGAPVELERPSSSEHGDYATNAALQLAPKRKRPPREIAEELAEQAAGLELVERAEVAGPGFVNLWLAPAWYGDALSEILEAGDAYGGGFAEPVEREAGERDLAGGIDLRNQIKRLAYDDQLLLHLYYALDLPGREVAQVLGIRMGAVKSRLHRVTRRLRSQLATAEVTS